jgi:hypothetical protein
MRPPPRAPYRGDPGPVPLRPTWSQRKGGSEPPPPAATVSADRARAISQDYLSRHHAGLFALPAVLGALRGREVWFIPVGRLGTAGTTGQVEVDAVTGTVGEVRIDPPAG